MKESSPLWSRREAATAIASVGTLLFWPRELLFAQTSPHLGPVVLGHATANELGANPWERDRTMLLFGHIARQSNLVDAGQKTPAAAAADIRAAVERGVLADPNVFQPGRMMQILLLTLLSP